MNNKPQTLSLLDAIMGVIAPIRRPEPRPARREQSAPPSKASQPLSEGAIVDRRDEAGVKHRGDFPNPSAGTYRGCF